MIGKHLQKHFNMPGEEIQKIISNTIDKKFTEAWKILCAGSDEYQLQKIYPNYPPEKKEYLLNLIKLNNMKIDI